MGTYELVQELDLVPVVVACQGDRPTSALGTLSLNLPASAFLTTYRFFSFSWSHVIVACLSKFASLQAVAKIQAAVRGRSERRAFVQSKKAAGIVQVWVRGRLQRRWYLALKGQVRCS